MLGGASTRGTETERVGQRLGIKGRKRKKEGPAMLDGSREEEGGVKRKEKPRGLSDGVREDRRGADV